MEDNYLFINNKLLYRNYYMENFYTEKNYLI
jgi:hypothetical protein